MFLLFLKNCRYTGSTLLQRKSFQFWQRLTQTYKDKGVLSPMVPKLLTGSPKLSKKMHFDIKFTFLKVQASDQNPFVFFTVLSIFIVFQKHKSNKHAHILKLLSPRQAIPIFYNLIYALKVFTRSQILMDVQNGCTHDCQF